ncbi:alpha/beta fold hydrolase [soil metagenome]
MPTIDVPAGRLHYLDSGGGGDGVPLVLVHAFPLSSAMWEDQIADLAPGYRVIAPDLRGFGESDVPSEPGAYSVDGWADDVAALLGALGLARVVLGGLSMGGYVAFAYLRRHRQTLAGLVMADTRPGVDTAEVRARRDEQQRQLRAESEPVELADSLLQPLVGRSTTRREEALDTGRALLARNRTAGVIGALEALKNRPDSTGDLAGIDVPTLVVVGEQDQLSPPNVAEEMAGAIPGSRLLVVPDAGHVTNLENPAAFNHALREFLAQI